MLKRYNKLKQLFTKKSQQNKGQAETIPLSVMFGGLRETADEVKKAASECEQACEMANISLSKWLFISLTEGVSFKGFEKKGDYILAGADDFYAYRRKAVYHFKMLLAEQKV